jgi:hypothetical protein
MDLKHRKVINLSKRIVNKVEDRSKIRDDKFDTVTYKVNRGLQVLNQIDIRTENIDKRFRSFKNDGESGGFKK